MPATPLRYSQRGGERAHTGYNPVDDHVEEGKSYDFPWPLANMKYIFWRCFTQLCRGLVTLKKSLNYEERSSYNLVVEAQDAGDNILSSTASIFVQVSATTAIL